MVLVRLVVVHVVRSVEVISFTVGLSSVTEHSLGSVLDEGLMRVRAGGTSTHLKQLIKYDIDIYLCIFVFKNLLVRKEKL